MANKKKKAGQAITPKKAVLRKAADKKLYITLAIAIAAVILIVVGLIFLIAFTNNNSGSVTATPLDEEENVISGQEEEAGGSGDTDTGADTEDGKYYADITVKDYGTISLELDAETAPITVQNFVDLAESGFYDGLTFHRIMEGFMIQGGDPEGTGLGGSGTTIKGEFSSNGVENDISHVRGVISMARNSLSMDSASSQFFIVQEDSTFLDGDYAAFGHVISGMEVVDAIAADANPTDDNGTIPAEDQPVIESITVHR